MSDDRLAKAKALLARLIAFDSVSDASNLPLIDFVEDYLASLGVASRRAPNAAGDKAALLATDRAARRRRRRPLRPYRRRAGRGPALDERPVRAARGVGRLYGRGACDMKGFDACVLAMVPTFTAAPLKRPVHIVLSYDEETTCLGSRDVIAWFGRDEPRPGAVIVGEPTMMEVADAHKSVATFRTRVTGHEAHSALPALGANAVAAAADIVSEIGRLAREYEEGPLDPRFAPPYSTLHVGIIQGGTARNILARECTFHWEFRGLPGVPTASALAKVQAFVDAVAAAAAHPLRRRPFDRDRDRSRRAAAQQPSPARSPKRSPCGSPAPTDGSRSPSPPKPGTSRRPACRRSSAGPARSTRRTSPTNSSTNRSSPPASPFSTISRANSRGEDPAPDRIC